MERVTGDKSRTPDMEVIGGLHRQIHSRDLSSFGSQTMRHRVFLPFPFARPEEIAIAYRRLELAIITEREAITISFIVVASCWLPRYFAEIKDRRILRSPPPPQADAHHPSSRTYRPDAILNWLIN